MGYVKKNFLSLAAIRGVQLHNQDGPTAGFTKDLDAPESGAKPALDGRPGVNRSPPRWKTLSWLPLRSWGGCRRSRWEAEIEVEGIEDGMKQFYKVLAVRELKTFGLILARMMPEFVHRTTTKKNVPTLLTEEQVLAELKEAGIPLDVIKHMHAVDITNVDTFQLDGDPYNDPEDDERRGSRWST